MTLLSQFHPEGLVFEGRTLRVEALAHGVVRLTLDRPELRNAFDGTMIQELSQALATLAAEPDPDRVRLLLLEGAGPVFCAGADLAYMRDQVQVTREVNLEHARELGRMFHQLASFPAPVLSYVRGAAIGGGLGLVACSDFVLADPAAVVATSEVMLGLAPAVISPYLVRRLGLAHSAPMMLSGRRFGTAEALAMGLVQRQVDPGETGEQALTRVLREFLAAGPAAARATRELLLRIAPLPDPERLEFTASMIAGIRVSAEGQAGLNAFFDKTPPPWSLPTPPLDRRH